MKRFFLVCLVVIGVWGSVAYAITGPNPFDSVLVARKLTYSQEYSYINKGSIASPFWNYWYNNPATVDYLYLSPSKNTRLGAVFVSESDAQLWIWAAWGNKGLYLYCKIIDDSVFDFNACAAQGNCEPEFDRIDFYLDENSSAYQRAFPGGFYTLRWTLTMVEYQIIPELTARTFRFNRRDSNWISSQDIGSSIQHNSFTFAEGESLGIQIKVIDTNPADSLRIVEMLIPWEHFSYNGLAVPSVGDQVAAVFGYNDIDGIGLDGVNQLRWKRSDPYSQDDCWGDIEFGPLLVDLTPGVLNPARYVSRHKSSQSCRTSYYTLSGRQIPSPTLSGHPQTSNIIIQKSFDQHNRLISSKLLVAY